MHRVGEEVTDWHRHNSTNLIYRYINPWCLKYPVMDSLTTNSLMSY